MREEKQEKDMSNMSSDFTWMKQGTKTPLNFQKHVFLFFLSLCRHLEKWQVSSGAWFWLAELDQRSLEDESVGG